MRTKTVIFEINQKQKNGMNLNHIVAAVHSVRLHCRDGRALDQPPLLDAAAEDDGPVLHDDELGQDVHHHGEHGALFGLFGLFELFSEKTIFR